jgi:hypothetical protein
MLDQPLLFLLEGHHQGGAGTFGFGCGDHRTVGFQAALRAEHHQELRPLTGAIQLTAVC